MKTALDDRTWNKLAEKNAKHRARLHIESNNPEKIAEAMHDMPVLPALEFLFTEAEKYRKEHKLAQAATILAAVDLIDRKTQETIELDLEENGATKETTLVVKRCTPADIFRAPIKD